MRVLGIDPSLTSTGLALVEGGRVVNTGRIRSKAKGYTRVESILDAISHELTTDDPRYPLYQDGRRYDTDIKVGIEGPAMGAKGSSVVQIFGLWATITHQLWRWGLEPYIVPPSNRVKYATGKGNSSKDEVLAAVVRRYADVNVTGNDVADALIVAAMGARRYGVPLEQTLPAVNLTAMDKVQWA